MIILSVRSVKTGISARQGVYDIIKRCDRLLDDYEENSFGSEVFNGKRSGRTDSQLCQRDFKKQLHTRENNRISTAD